MLLSRRSALLRAVMVALTGAVVLSVAGGSIPGSVGLVPRGRPVLGPTRLAGAAPVTGTLRLYYRSPVLVRAGERVVIPVDVACATVDGDPCSDGVELDARVGSEPWRSSSASGDAPESFDLSAPSARAAPSGNVKFFLRATDGEGKTAASLGGARPETALRFYVTDVMRTATMPAIPFGEVRKGEEVLSLPWGSGDGRAGLELGVESDTLGPTSFDVDRDSRIYLLDALQHRLAVFEDGRLEREVNLPETLFDVAATGDGSAFVLSRVDGSLTVRRVEGSGAVSPPASLGEAIPGQIETARGRAFVNLLPLDAWTEVPAPGQALDEAPAIRIGRPLADGELLRVARPEFLRLGTVSGGRVVDSVELRSADGLGEVALAETDGEGGYWAVVHVWQDQPSPADQYEVVHVRDGTILTAFAVPNRHFATVPASNRFRLAGGFLYQMASSPEGIQIVRYGLGEES